MPPFDAGLLERHFCILVGLRCLHPCEADVLLSPSLGPNIGFEEALQPSKDQYDWIMNIYFLSGLIGGALALLLAADMLRPPALLQLMEGHLITWQL